MDSIENNRIDQWLPFTAIELILACLVLLASRAVGNKWMTLLNAIFLVFVSFMIDASTFNIRIEKEYYYLLSFQVIVGVALIIQAVFMPNPKDTTTNLARL